MTYKQKHLAMLTVSAAMLTLATGCQKQQAPTPNKEKVGLLDDTPIQTHDKYGSKITIYLVEVPLYDQNGKRLKDTYMLTRGLQKQDFTGYSSGNNMQLKAVCFNNSKDPVYVMVDENSAIKTVSGYAGLFAENGKAILVSEDNANTFASEIKQSAEKRRTAQRQYKEMPTEVMTMENNDSQYSDSTFIAPDTISWEDSLRLAKPQTIKQDTVKQAVSDTLLVNQKQQEVR